MLFLHRVGWCITTKFFLKNLEIGKELLIVGRGYDGNNQPMNSYSFPSGITETI